MSWGMKIREALEKERERRVKNAHAVSDELFQFFLELFCLKCSRLVEFNLVKFAKENEADLDTLNKILDEQGVMVRDKNRFWLTDVFPKS